MKDLTINDLQASIIALNLQKRENINISGTEINFLDYLKKLSEKESPILIRRISEELNVSEDFISFILERLTKIKLVKRNSPQVIITEEGERLLQKCYEMIPDVDENIKKDVFFSKVSPFSRSITEK